MVTVDELLKIIKDYRKDKLATMLNFNSFEILLENDIIKINDELYEEPNFNDSMIHNFVGY